MSEKRFAAATAWSSEPKKSQEFRPTAMGRRARSLALFSKRSRLSSKNRWRASRWRSAYPKAVAHDDPFHVAGFRNNHIHAWSIRFVQPELGAAVAASLSKRTSHHLVSAALHELAADVKLATPERERWSVQTDRFYDVPGRVYPKLADATPAEVERGMAVLKTLAG